MNRKAILITCGGVLVAAGVSIGIVILTTSKSVSQSTTIQKSDTSNTPPYTTLLPKGKNIEQLGGWHKLASPNGDIAYTYTDTINGITISLSQQPLPEAFKADATAKLASLAKSDNATDSLDINGSTAYVATSAKGPQSVYYTKNGLLVLIKSEASLPDASWKKYLASLQ